MNNITSRIRREAKATLHSVEAHVAHWSKQIEGAPVMLDIEAPLQKLFGMRMLEDVKRICEEVEEIIIESFDDDGIGEQLALTAYNSLCAVGFDCSSFEWALEVKMVSDWDNAPSWAVCRVTDPEGRRWWCDVKPKALKALGDWSGRKMVFCDKVDAPLNWTQTLELRAEVN